MAFLGSLDIVGSALSAERTRMDVTLQIFPMPIRHVRKMERLTAVSK